MNKKILLGILCVALVGIIGTSVVADTWISKKVSISIFTGSSIGFALYCNCDATIPVTPFVQTVTQGNTYEFTMYVLNNGTDLLYITYLPTDSTWDTGQTRFHITVDVLNYGIPSQMVGNNIPLPTGISVLPYALPEKSITTPTNGFPLSPNKMIKLDIMVRVDSVDLSGTQPWVIPFEVCAVAGV